MMLNFRTSCWSSFHTIAGRCMLRGASKTGSKLKFPQQQYQQYWNTSSQQSKGRLYGDRLPHGSFKGKAGKTLSKLKNKPHLLVLFGIAAVFFQLALDKVPISGRWRMNFISNRFLEALKPAPLLDRIKSSEKTVLPDTTPEVKLIQKVFDRLILCNDLQHVMSSMKILVNTSSDSIPFAGVMRDTIIIDTCFLQIANSEDLLAFLLAHEIAHSLAEHVGEIHSHLVVTMPLCLLIGLPLCWYYNDMSYVEHIYDMLFELPLSRKQESEADYMGLMMMARSSYNPEGAVLFHERLDVAYKARAHGTRRWHELPRFTSTHPLNHERTRKMKEWLPEALAQAKTLCLSPDESLLQVT